MTDSQEAVSELLFSPGWQIVLRKVLLERYESLARQALMSDTLTEKQHGMIVAQLRVIRETIRRAYDLGEQPLPESLKAIVGDK